MTTHLLRLWGKTGIDDGTAEEFHPAIFHMLDAGHVAQVLLSDYASPRWRRVLAVGLGTDENFLSYWLPWLVALHDIGKISAVFQEQNSVQKARLTAEGVSFGDRSWNNDPYHTFTGQVFMAAEMANIDWCTNIIAVAQDAIGGHHGLFAPPGGLRETRSKLAREPAIWAEWRKEASEILKTILVNQVPKRWPEPRNFSAAIMVLTGFTILCDWLASDSRFFKPRSGVSLSVYVSESTTQAREAVEAAGFFRTGISNSPTAFHELFPERRLPRPLQREIDQIPVEVLSEPCLAVIEAPTGEGKTEASLALAHRLAQANGTDEFYYALPTMATSNQMFSRIQQYLQANLGLSTKARLIHSQAFLMEDDFSIHPLGDNSGSNNEASPEWFAPKKRALLAQFGVGTIDQAELAALNVKHTALRQIGLAGKVVILDEVHAYDTYMTAIIERLLNWLSALGTSVILLSATLPQSRRLKLACAYSETGTGLESQPAGYPQLWIVSKSGSYSTSPPAYQPDRVIHVERSPIHHEDPDIKACWLLDSVKSGGCACWITNTVKRAQQIFQALDRQAPSGVDRLLLHSQFPLEDRLSLESDLVRKYGPGTAHRPEQGIVVGTQVLEQSLDVDFDLMVSDLAPVDLLLQRAGRLHRHDRYRSPDHHQPQLWIYTEQGVERGETPVVDSFIYDEFILLKTWQVIVGLTEIVLPRDYRSLVEAVYGSEIPAPDSLLAEAWQAMQNREKDALEKARMRLLPEPDPEESFCGPASHLTFEEDEDRAAWVVAQTRLGEESITVIPLEKEGGKARFITSDELTWFDLNTPASRKDQMRLLRRSMRVSNRQLVKTLQAVFGKAPPLFRESALLKRCFPLWLTDQQTILGDGKNRIHLALDSKLGLVIELKKGD